MSIHEESEIIYTSSQWNAVQQFEENEIDTAQKGVQSIW